MRLKFWSDAYPPSVKPMREGAYLTCIRDDGEPDEVRIWLDGAWHFVDGIGCFFQDLYWKGIAFDPGLAGPCTGVIVSAPSQRVLADVPGVWIPWAVMEGGE